MEKIRKQRVKISFYRPGERNQINGGERTWTEENEFYQVLKGACSWKKHRRKEKRAELKERKVWLKKQIEGVTKTKIILRARGAKIEIYAAKRGGRTEKKAKGGKKEKWNQRNVPKTGGRKKSKTYLSNTINWLTEFGIQK